MFMFMFLVMDMVVVVCFGGVILYVYVVSVICCYRSVSIIS